MSRFNLAPDLVGDYCTIRASGALSKITAPIYSLMLEHHRCQYYVEWMLSTFADTQLADSISESI